METCPPPPPSSFFTRKFAATNVPGGFHWSKGTPAPINKVQQQWPIPRALYGQFAEAVGDGPRRAAKGEDRKVCFCQFAKKSNIFKNMGFLLF